MAELLVVRKHLSLDHHRYRSRDKALDREDGSELLVVQSARNNAIVIRGVHDVATVHTLCFETRALVKKAGSYCKLVALVNLVTQQLVRIEACLCCKNKALDREDGSNKALDRDYQFSVRIDAIVIRGVHNVATDTSAETRKLEGKLDALLNLVTQLATKQKSASVARQFSARNDAIVIRGVHDVATDTSTKTRKLEGKLDALVNLVTQLAANQKPASVARVCGIRPSNDHHTSVCTSSRQSGVDEYLEAYAANTNS
ncbi:hypothetical protein Fmac_028614 [Flemingia macrophylla]|uniref:Uncharacterized protein n=1 Tax=Flemingia macrophylla TaxID=520843 RepID=A0ABD1L805_9FABA